MNTKIIRTLARTGAVLLLACAVLAPCVAFAKKASDENAVITYRMSPTGADPDARGKVQFKPVTGRERLRVVVKDLPVGAYDLDLDGTVVAAINVATDTIDGGTIGQVRFAAKDGTYTFDPRGRVLDVAQAGIVFLSTVFPNSFSESKAMTVIDADLSNIGTYPNALGEAHFRSKAGRSRFAVEVLGLPPGPYELQVGGTARGTILVDDMMEGEIRFDTVPSGEDDEALTSTPSLLTFDPRGQWVQVLEGYTVILEVEFPPVQEAAPQTQSLTPRL
jgi:hypothetical protein